MSTGTSCHFGHLLQVSKKTLWSLILYNFFMILYMYIAPGQGETAPRGQSFDVNRNVLSLQSFVASFKKMSLKSDFIQFFHDLIHVYSPGAGATAPSGQSFDVNRKALSLYPFVASFKKISLKSDFIQFFSWFNTCIYPQGSGHTAPRRQSFDVNRNFLSLRSSIASFKS